MYSFLAWAIPLLALFTLALARMAPQHASRLRFVLWVVILATAFVVTAVVLPDARWPWETARTLVELACVQASAIFVFHVLLRRFALPRLASDLAIGAGYLAVIISALTRIGANVTGLITTSAVLTAVIGFAFQDMLANLVGGLVLQFERGFVEGDWIRTDHGIGLVRSIRLRHTSLETPDNDIMIIPNSALTKSPLLVLGRARGREEPLKHRHLIRFHAGYQYSPGAVIEAVEHALSASPVEGIATEPSPRCLLLEYDPGSVQYGVLVWLLRPGVELVDSSSVRRRIYFALTRAGIKPQSIPYIVNMDHAAAPALTEDPAAALNGLEIFRSLEQEESRRLASQMKRARFAEGEVILREGDEGDSLYVIENGSVRVMLARDTGLIEQVAQLGPGDFFGEMSLLTGSPRSATVVALKQTDCLTLHKPDLHTLLESRPQIAAEIAGIVSKRQSELEFAREKLSEQELRLKQQSRRQDLLMTIQRYFGLTVKS
jgi:small-conductance mechanosensitive channel/CRP-like cAMP-binding protein